MSEFSQSRRLQDAELPVGPELWARLEGRLAGTAQQAPRRFRIGYWAVAASLVLAFVGGMFWQSQLQSESPALASASQPKTPKQRSSSASFAPQASSAPSVAVSDNQNCTPDLSAPIAPFIAAKPGFVAKRQTRRCSKESPALAQAPSSNPSPPRTSTSSPSASEQAQAALSMTVAQFNAPALVMPPADSLRVISPAIGSQDSLAILLAVTSQRFGRDSLKAAKTKPQQKQTIINKINRALRWLPGGSAWPTIRFEKAEVAVAFHEEPQQGVAP